jgi:DNA-binding transcriptional LysR family regulator
MSQHPLHHFESFLCVASCGGFTAAAKKMGVSKAAVSHSIRLLEASLTTPLFIRTTRSVRLTAEGELLLKQCKKIKVELDAARSMVAGFKETPSGHLKMSCNPYFAEALLAEVVQRYSAAYPEVTLELLSEERMPDMAREQVDVVFGVNWPPPQEIVARPIGTTRYVLCASPDYLKKHGVPQHVQDLEQHRYILHAGRRASDVVVDLKKKQTLAMPSPIACHSAHLMKACALQHLGIIQLHDYMVAQELADGRLVEVLGRFLKPAIPLYVYYQKDRWVQPKIKKMIECIFEVFDTPRK